MEVFKNRVETNLNKDFSTESFEELIYLVIDWDPKRPEFQSKNYLFGSMGGQKYMTREFSINLNQCFTQTKCYLLPSIGIDVTDKDLPFDKINTDLIAEFLQLIQNKLLNIDEMQVKTGADRKTGLKADQLLPLFRASVNHLNQSLSDNCEDIDETEDTNEELMSKESVERELSISSRSSIEVIKEEDYLYADNFSSDEEQEQTETTDAMSQTMWSSSEADSQGVGQQTNPHSLNEMNNDFEDNISPTSFEPLNF